MFIEIKECKKCNLYKNQPPLTDRFQASDVMWVGLSAKKITALENEAPLSCCTNSGKIINQVECAIDGLNFYKTNLVKCVPLNENGKLRYPLNEEMSICYSNLKYEIDTVRPKIVFLLGGKVAKFVLENENMHFMRFDDNFDYMYYKIENKYYVPIHHPSYIYVYKRKHINNYISDIRKVIDRVVCNEF